MRSIAPLRGTESQPHAAAVLVPALPPEGVPSHAYLFHGPPGSGKRTAAEAFATRLLADAEDLAVAERVARRTHPDLTWVTPTGAAEMLVADIDEPVVAAATRTPFEAPRRVFVIEGADAMNDRAANRLLKTLEEPPDFAHLILLAHRREDVLPTIVSRCQLVRFDPLPPAAIEALLLEQNAEPQANGAQPVEPQAAAACARLALGDAELAERLTGATGASLRTAARAFAEAMLHDEPPASSRPWRELLDAAGSAGADASEQALQAVEAELQLLPAKERRKREREGVEAARRQQRRQRTEILDLGLRLAELWLRDMICLAEGAPELVHALDMRRALEEDLAALREHGRPAALPRAIELVSQTRQALAQNVSEELALEALHCRAQEALAA
jgi:DNA polymerase III subunit delta'